MKKGAHGSTRFYRGPLISKSKSWRLHGDIQVADLIGPGRQSVLPPSRHPSGCAYVWTGPDALEDVSPADLPELTREHIVAIDAALTPFGYREPVALPERDPATFVCSDARGREYGLGALYGCAAELAQCESGRNNLLNILAGRLGRCVARGWLSEQECWAACWNAGVRNGMISDNGERQFAATFRSGLVYGLSRPMPDPRERLTIDPAFAARIKNLNAARSASIRNLGVKN
jgi:bifunctional DNA primase/polymerase-like protein